jgi:Protein of unknown function (DUF2497)
VLGHLNGGSDLLNGKTPTAVAASQALEKLAVGLSESQPMTPLRPDAVSTPEAAVSVAPQAAPPVLAATPRTLEDTVTDMLRPMLEKWVETNMPRLMEKALRGDTGKGPKAPGV